MFSNIFDFIFKKHIRTKNHKLLILFDRFNSFYFTFTEFKSIVLPDKMLCHLCN